MRGLIFEQGSIRLAEDLPEPIPREGEVSIRVALAGICATDLEIAKGYMHFEGVLGHEFVGYVDAPDQPEWHEARTVGGINCGCGSCPLCLEHRERHCPNRTVLGILNKPGAFAERITLPLANLVRVPDAMATEDAVYAEPLAAALRITEQMRITENDRVAVLGDGRLGLLTAGMGAALGWNLILIGRHPKRQELLSVPYCSTHEAPTSSFDVVVECTGSEEGFSKALSLLKPEGRLVLKTTVAEREALNLNTVVINEVTIIGSRCGPLDLAIDFLAKGLCKPSKLTSQCFPLSQGVEAFKAASDPNRIKVLLKIDS